MQCLEAWLEASGRLDLHITHGTSYRCEHGGHCVGTVAQTTQIISRIRSARNRMLRLFACRAFTQSTCLDAISSFPMFPHLPTCLSHINSLLPWRHSKLTWLILAHNLAAIVATTFLAGSDVQSGLRRYILRRFWHSDPSTGTFLHFCSDGCCSKWLLQIDTNAIIKWLLVRGLSCVYQISSGRAHLKTMQRITGIH